MPTIVSSYIPTSGSVDSRTADSLSFPFNARPQAMTVYLRFQERGTSAISNGNGFLLFVGSGTGVTSPHLGITVGSLGYALRYQPGRGATASFATLAAFPAVGQIVELMATLSAAGLPTIYQSINGAATTSAVTTVHPLPPAWSGSILYLNSAAGSLSGAAAFLNVLIVRGVQDIITMRRLADVP